jgi:hypothetical protein
MVTEPALANILLEIDLCGVRRSGLPEGEQLVGDIGAGGIVHDGG